MDKFCKVVIKAVGFGKKIKRLLEEVVAFKNLGIMSKLLI